MTNTPLFVTFEGIDGCGKTSTIGLVASMLTKRNLRVTCTWEPTGTPIGIELRNVVERWQKSGLEPATELYLYLAARAQHVEEVLKPALESGRVVLCDRYYDSTLVYQGLCGNIGVRRVCVTHEDASSGLMPNLTLWLDTAPETALARIHSRDKKDMTSLTDLQRWSDGYREAYNFDPSRICRVDGNCDHETVAQACFDKIWEALCDKFGSDYLENIPELEIK